MTYLPISMPDRAAPTSDAWKDYGNGDVFTHERGHEVGHGAATAGLATAPT